MKKSVLLLLFFMFFFGCKSQNSVKVLTAEEFSVAIKEDKEGVILDVRRPEEFAAGHIEGAILLNFLDTVAFNAGIEKLDKEKTYYVYCRSGRRSAIAADALRGLGYKDVKDFGGISRWKGELEG